MNGTPEGKSLTDLEKDELFEENIQELNKMGIGAGSLVKDLIIEIQDRGRDTYIRLHDAVPGGFIVMYDLVHGDPDLVLRVGRALGFKEVSPSKLEVYSG
jgi:hypothetical protein